MSAMLLEGPVLTRVEHVWGTVVSIDIRDEGATDAALDVAWESVRAELHRVDRLFSTFRPDSVVSRLRGGGRHVVADDVAEVIDRCLEARGISMGAFDPWAAAGGFDPSGLVKGWAADRCARILRQHGFREFCVDAAGDLVCRGRLGGNGWPIGVAHPDDPMAVLAVADVLDEAIATSGSSQRGDHIVDPRTGGPASGARQATVIGPDAAITDALATALVVEGVEGARWFAHLPQWSGAVVVDDTLTWWGPAFRAPTPDTTRLTVAAA